MEKYKIGIAGGAGYTGGELLRLLVNHPFADIRFVHSNSNAGNLVSQVHAGLEGDTDLRFTATIDPGIDVLFLCVGHGEARKFLDTQKIPDTVRVIDLSQDFRLRDTAAHGSRQFVYGLPELDREKIRGAGHVANPGCFATCIQLGLLPLAHAGLLQDVYTTGITGSTGAGQSLTASSHFSWRSNNIQAYKTLTHQHLHEILQSLAMLQADFGHRDGQLSFIPWRGDFTRGIFVSSLLNCDRDPEQLEKIYNDYYKDHPFVHVSREPIFLKQVVNTNKCLIQLEKTGGKLVVHSIIDNLLKGASGQALQNMNLMLGLEETTGLRLKAAAF